MHITGFRIIELDVPVDPPFPAAWDPEPRRLVRQTLLLVETDEGLAGVSGGDLSGVEPLVRHFVGTDPTELDTQARRLASCCYSGGRLWPIEAALYDLAGRAEGRSVAEMLGGSVDRVRAYASAGTRRDPEAWADVVEVRVDEGFDALKMRLDVFDPEQAVACVEVARQGAPDGFALMVDLNQAWRMPGDVSRQATTDDVLAVVGPFAELGVTWLEEPLVLDDVEGLRRLRADAGDMRIAGGEFLLATTESWRLLDDEVLGVYQQDVQLTLGITEGARFGRAVIETGGWYTPHTWGDAFSLLVNLHVTCGVGGGPWLEYPHDPPGWRAAVRDTVLTTPTEPDADGWLHVPKGPGLGVELDWDTIDDLTVADRILR